MKKLFVAVVFFILPLLTTCELFENDIPEFMEYYTGSAVIEHHVLNGAHLTDSNGIANISPENDKTIIFTLRNPQQYTLNLAINWASTPIGSGGGDPVRNTDYTLEQDPNNKNLANLTFRKAFLDAADKDTNRDNLSASISLTEPGTSRAFDEIYSYQLESNSQPLPAREPRLMKENTGNYNSGNYILCLKLPDYNLIEHRDIKTLRITDINGTSTEYTINHTPTAKGDGAITNNDGKIIADVSNITKWKDSEEDLPTDYDATSDGIFYNTGDVVGKFIRYTITFIDDNGLSSAGTIIDNRPSIVYLNPTAAEGGIGTEANPVNTMAAALALLGTDPLPSNATIWVMGTIPVNGSTNWSYTATAPLTLKRHSNFEGTLVNVEGGTLNLANITIDGQGTTASSALVTIQNNASVTLNNTTLQNNKAGGVNIVTTNGTLNLAGGTINISGNTLAGDSSKKSNIIYPNNASSSPVKVTGPISVVTPIGLSPSSTSISAGNVAILVQANNASHLNIGDFSFDTATVGMIIDGTSIKVKDEVPPIITGVSFVSSSGGAYAKAGDNILLTVDATDAESGMGGYAATLMIDTSEVSGKWEDNKFIYTVQNDENGDVSFTDITATDNARNTTAFGNGTVVGNVLVDTIAPNISKHELEITSRNRAITPENYVNEKDVITLTVTASDGGSGLATEAYTATIYINGGGVAKTTQSTGVFTHTVLSGESGEVTYTATVTDKAGNVATASSGTPTIGVDNTAPPTPTATFTASDTVHKTTLDNKYYYKGGTDGIKFTFAATDLTVESMTSGIKSYYVTTTLASTTQPTQDVLEGINADTTKTLTAGTHYIYAVDNAYNISTPLELIVAKDTAGPSIGIVTLGSNAYSGSYAKVGNIITLTATITDTGSGIKGTPTAVLNLSGGGTIDMGNPSKASNVYTFTYTISDTTYNGKTITDGTITATDNVDNSNSGSSAVSNMIVDTTNPTATIALTVTSSSSTPSDYAKEGDTITLTVTSSDTGGSGLKTATPSGNIQIGTGNVTGNNWTSNTYTYTVQDGKNGAVAIGDVSVTVEDNAGNTNTITSIASGNVTVDTTAPIIDTASMIISDSGSVTLTINANDAGGIPSTGAYNATIMIGTITVTGGSWSGNVFTTTANNYTGTSAALTYSVTVTDSAGNESAASTGVAKGTGGGWAYYAKDAGGGSGVVAGTNPAITGKWYEISEELPDDYQWAGAKTAASTHTQNSVNGWKLPTKAELNAAYVSLYSDSKPLHDSTLTNYLWSSSEGNNVNAWFQLFFDGYQYFYSKPSNSNVRVVRAFNP